MISQLEKSHNLKGLLNSECLEFLMEAHSGLSAVIAEEVGFKGLWASGLSMSAMTGCRDRNELDISEVCKIVEWMSDHTNIPILVDGDTGGVDINAARIMVNKLVKAGAAGVCIEDKLYPKHNSFLDNSGSDLANPEVHAGKIRAMKDENPEFVVIARLEEFISGLGVDEAYRRALIYQEAGADAILVHSKIKTADEIISFMTKWNDDKKQGKVRVPIVIVPTKYYKVSTGVFRDIGISTVIWANHNLRASITAMEEVSKEIYKNQSLESIESRVAPVSEVFRLQKDSEAEEMERKYMPNPSEGSALILGGKDSSSGVSVVKTLIDKDTSYLAFQTETYASRGINRIGLVVSDSNKGMSYNVDKLVVNKMHNSSEVGSIYYGLKECSYRDLPFYISYGDIAFKRTVIDRLNEDTEADIVIAVESSPSHGTHYKEYVTLDFDNTPKYSGSYGIKSCGTQEPSQFSMIGMMKVNSVVAFNAMFLESDRLRRNSNLRFIDLLKELLTYDSLNIKCVICSNHDWFDLDDSSKNRTKFDS